MPIRLFSANMRRKFCRVPLDADDEGFESINLDATITDVYRYFLAAVNEYEVSVAYALARAGINPQ